MSSSDRVFQVLEAVVARQREGAAYRDVQADTGLANATVHRILKNLVELGYLNYAPQSKLYKGSLKLAGLGAEVTVNFNLREHLHPVLLRLHKETNYTANAGILNGAEGVYIDRVDTQDYGIRLIGEVGRHFPLYCTGMGKALLAHAPQEVLDQVTAGPLKKLTANTITDVDKLLEELRQVREQGYSLDREEITRGIFCVAAPVLDRSGHPLCAVSVAFPRFVVDEGGLKGAIEAVKSHTAELSGIIV